MFYIKKIYFTFIFIIGFSSILLSQNINFFARADARQVPLGGYVEVSFTLQNANLENPQLPDFRNFNVMSGPNRGSSISIINGVKTVEETISFTLQTKSLGVFTLAPAKINLKGKNYTTESVQIEVVKGSTINKGNQKTAFLALEADVKDTYVGGQIVLDLKLYANTTIRPVSYLGEPNLSDFFQKEIEELNVPPIREVVKGIQYQTQIIKRMILYPQKEGSFNISPYSISAMTGEIFNSNMVSLQSNELIINVKNLPNNPPLFFNGAVGTLELESTINKNEATTDEALSMQLTIIGKGDANRVFAPKFNISDSLEIYEPKLISETDISQSGAKSIFSKTFEYLIVPKYSGQYEIKPSLTYFDTETNKFETISTSAHQIQISQGSGKNNVTPVTNTPDIKVSSSWAYTKILISIALLSGIGLFFWWSKKRKKANAFTNEVIDNKTEALKESIVIPSVINKIDYLSAAKKSLDDNDLNSFYKHLSKTILTHITTYFGVSENTYSREELFSKLEHSPKAQFVSEIKQLLSICDKMRFGAGQSEYANTELLEKTKSLCNQFKE